VEAQETDEDDMEDPGPQTRGVVVLDRRLRALERHLRDRNMLVIGAPADDIEDSERPTLLACRVLIVQDEAPYVYDASSYCIGIVSVRMLSNREPQRLAKVISDALVDHRPWDRRHGFLLLLNDDGEHEFEPLVD
jgi:hypothetical protein